jgi:hypothetical protein
MNRDIIKLLNFPLQESLPHLYGHFFIARRGGPFKRGNTALSVASSWAKESNFTTPVVMDSDSVDSCL